MEDNLLTRIVAAFLRGPLSPMFIVVCTLLGLMAVLATSREEEPQIVVPMADVFVSFPGATAEEVEKLVATPLEKLLWQIDGVEHVYSISRRDGALVTVRFFVGEDRERALVRLQSRIEANRDKAPPGVSGWVVKPIEIDDVPIVTLTLWSKEASGFELRRVAEEFASRLESVANLSRTELIGGYPREVRVQLDAEALAAHHLSPLEVAQVLQAADASLAAGSFSRANKTIKVVAGPFIGDRQEVERLVVGSYNERPVYLGDVAKVVDGPSEASSYVRFSHGQAAVSGVPKGEAFEAVTLALSKKKGSNAVAVAEEVLQMAQKLKRELLPAQMQMEVTRNYGETANEKVNELLHELGLAIITVVILIVFFLGWREGVVVAAVIPIAFALTLFVNFIAGYSINRVTLFALVLCLGLVADDPIVDVENIHRHFKMKKFDPFRAVLVAINEVRRPVIVATFAVMISFLPMFFITGMMGPYMRPMALNVPVAMLMSLVVAFTVTPWLSYLLLRSEYGKEKNENTEEQQESRLYYCYRQFLSLLLEKKTLRYSLLWVVLGLILLTVVLLLTGAVPLKMLPYDNKSELQLVLDLPEGTSLEATNAVVNEFEYYLRGIPELVNMQSYVGVASPMDFNGLVRHYNLRRGPHLADIRLNLLPKGQRSMQSHEIALRIRKDLEEISRRHRVALKIVEMPPGPPVLSTLVAEVTGGVSRSYDSLVAEAKRIKEVLGREKGAVDVDDMAEESTQRLHYLLDKEKAALHGVQAAEVVRTLALALSGYPAATVHEPNERNPLLLNIILPRAERSGAAELGRIQVRGTIGQLVHLAEIGKFVVEKEEQPIFHKDLERSVFVLGDVAGRPPAEVVLGIGKKIQQLELAEDIKINWSGEGEWNITVDVFRDLGLAFLAALVGIYVLLVIETTSFGMPFLIMLAIPLGAIGIFPGFFFLNLLTGNNIGDYANPVWFTATAMIGMIALAGIVVRNSIILIDFIRHRQLDGMPLRDAVLESGVKRLRPVILTAGAAMFGAWPITLDPIFSGLAWALIFGLIASTVFTLVVVPLVYALIYREKEDLKIAA